MIFLHTGCKYSEPWDDAFRSKLTQYTECDIRTLDCDKNSHFFIGRINESCLDIKKHYANLTHGFLGKWPGLLEIELYDDKFEQCKFLRKNGYPTPDFAILTEQSDSVKFPIVAKKSHGSASKNVWLARGHNDLVLPCLVQEFCEGNNGDLRITVIGDFVMGTMRPNRPNDFRASGSGSAIKLNALPFEAMDIAWIICKEHDFITMAFDFVLLGNRWVILEMSYTYPIYSVTNYSIFYCNMRTGERICRVPDPVDLLINCLFEKWDICGDLS